MTPLYYDFKQLVIIAQQIYARAPEFKLAIAAKHATTRA